MKERKNWTPQEDKVLKLLIEQRKMTKWSQISQVMDKQFSLAGRNGKQCRQRQMFSDGRYHNHLDQSISNAEWSIEQENKLFQMQEEVGNKWALISNQLPGRTDNCVKNHFYSKLRKSLRKLNKKVQKYLKKEYKDIKTATLYKIIEIMQNHHKTGGSTQTDSYDLCKKIKNQLRQYDDDPNMFQNLHEELNFIKGILDDLSCFDKEIKKPIRKSTLKLSSRLEQEEHSPRSKSQNLLSTNSAYDQDESEYSNSDMYSSSSFDHRSFCSNRSHRSIQRLKNEDKLCKSQEIASVSAEDSDIEEDSNNFDLYKSQKWKNTQMPKFDLKPNLLSASLQLPPNLCQNLKRTVKFSQFSQKRSQSAQKSKSQKSHSAENQSHIYTYLMGDQEPFAMRLFSPKKLTLEETIQMNNENDDLFYGEKMDIQGDSLVRNFSGMCLDDMPKLGRNSKLDI